jgi:hypothetical protein
MEEQRAQWPEGTFDVVWYQHNPDDWMAEVIDIRSGHQRRVYSLEELTQFIEAHLRVEPTQRAEM